MTNTHSLKGRFKESRTKLGLSQEELARIVGVSQASINKIETGATASPRRLASFAEHLGVTQSWLLFGDQSEFTKEVDECVQELALDIENKYMQSNAEYMGVMAPWSSKTELPYDEVEIPFFTEVELAAGNGMIEAQEHKGFKLRFSRSTLKKQGVDVESAACVKVTGNSMEPVLPDGSTIGIDTARTGITDGKMFALDHDGMLRVKTLYKVPGGGVRLKSFNSDEHPDEIYNKDESQLIRVIGRVFWYSVLL